MSDQLSAAARAMGIPEALAERSARARAEASGQSYEEVLAAWAGGEAVESGRPAEEPAGDEPTPAPSEPETETDEVTDTEPAATPAAATPQPAPDPAPSREPVAAGRPPVLEAPPDRPLVTVIGGLAVVALVTLLGFLFPSLPVENSEVRSSHIAFSDAAERGRQVYLSAGCASCHTQSVRAVVGDVGLGPVTLPDTNQVLGFRRIGPDLSDVGTRLDAGQIENVVNGPTHPATTLSGDDVGALVSYLSESATGPEGGAS